LPSEWHYGVYPDAAGMTVVSLGRVELPIGEALRVELSDADPGEDSVVVQYYVATESGEWALWVSCARSALAGLEATLVTMTPPGVLGER
jgi:hypothetical protein